MPRGFKTCPECHALVGPRTKICACGHEFVFGATKPSPVDTLPTPPVHTPRVDESDKVGQCPKHGKYQAKLPPKVSCESCWRMYLRDRLDLNVRPLDEALVVIANDEDELRSFIEALKLAADKSRYSGGGYAAFFHAKEGKLLQFDIQFPYKLP